jgi:hypothetical protein
MIRIAISVEGPTERDFTNYVLAPFLINYNITIEPIVITTSRERSGKKNSGGSVNIDRITNEVKKLLPAFDYVTTLYDFYGFKGIPDINNVDELELKLTNIFNTNKFIPYIQKYEFETLLFSNPTYYKDIFNDIRLSNEIEQVVIQFNNIEDINNSRETAPSKRLISIFKQYGEQYDKVFYGSSIAQDFGIDMIRTKAVRFNNWIEKLISLKGNN